MISLPDTVNYHFTPSCNMCCRFCFAGFKDCGRSSLEEQKSIIRAIASEPLPPDSDKPRRLNFVGGEPTVYPYLDDLILEAVRHGLQASVVTNGFNLVAKGLPKAFKHLSLLGVSIDSLDAKTNLRMGRSVSGRTISANQWIELLGEAQEIGLKVKINTVISAFNQHEDMSMFIAEAAPLRWKLFQALPVDGQNTHCIKEWFIDAEAFNGYVKRHRIAGVNPVVENEEMMRGSYAMISPDGRFFDSTLGMHQYSDSILQVGVRKAWGQVSFSNMKFNARTISYGRKRASSNRICTEIDQI